MGLPLSHLHDGFFVFRPVVEGTACAAFRLGRREVRVLCDDAGGELLDYTRTDIRCYLHNGEDVTRYVFDSEDAVISASVDNMARALSWLRGDA